MRISNGRANMTVDQVKKRIEDEGIEYFLCSFVEMSGAPKAKLVPATNFDEMSKRAPDSPDSRRAISARGLMTPT